MGETAEDMWGIISNPSDRRDGEIQGTVENRGISMFNPFARLRYKLNPEKAIDLKRNRTLHTQHFYNLSRETRIMAAREITESVCRLENVNGKMSQEDVFKFAAEMANHTVSRDELVCQDVAKLVMKLYHLGLQLPDHQL